MSFFDVFFSQDPRTIVKVYNCHLLKYNMTWVVNKKLSKKQIFRHFLMTLQNGFQQGMTCDVRQQVASCDVLQQVAMCGCKPILLKLAMSMLAVHFHACDVQLQLHKFFSNNVSYKDQNAFFQVYITILQLKN